MGSQVKLKTKFCGWRKHMHISSDVTHAVTFVFKLDIYIPVHVVWHEHARFSWSPLGPPPSTLHPNPHPHPAHLLPLTPPIPISIVIIIHNCALDAVMMAVHQQQSWCQREVSLYDLHMECVDVTGIVLTIAIASIPLQPPESIRSRRTPLYSLWETWNTTQCRLAESDVHVHIWRYDKL